MTDSHPTLSKVVDALRMVDISAYMSEVDGVLVIRIDTPDLDEDFDGPICRIYLNDDVVHENPVYPGRNLERQN